MGSVKKLKILSPAVDLKEGVGRLFFTDKFSIFDYGSMPDTIPDKGRALALIGAFFYELFEEHGIKTRYRGVIENGVRKKLDDISQPPEELELSLCHIFRPDFKDGQYVYPDYSLKQGNFFIPLEFIYRNRLPKWASIFKRLKSGEIT
ncbi:MAG: phosphoribosylaminoimidazolesuccinocarboxamide synthase, partial [Elusimicrobia bacterium]|nr:phosphoribosylaminoimidazolesuccinocarboxamide synthase [Elusimicrobiota bacterium]